MNNNVMLKMETIDGGVIINLGYVMDIAIIELTDFQMSAMKVTNKNIPNIDRGWQLRVSLTDGRTIYSVVMWSLEEADHKLNRIHQFYNAL